MCGCSCRAVIFLNGEVSLKKQKITDSIVWVLGGDRISQSWIAYIELWSCETKKMTSSMFVLEMKSVSKTNRAMISM